MRRVNPPKGWCFIHDICASRGTLEEVVRIYSLKNKVPIIIQGKSINNKTRIMCQAGLAGIFMMYNLECKLKNVCKRNNLIQLEKNQEEESSLVGKLCMQ